MDNRTLLTKWYEFSKKEATKKGEKLTQKILAEKAELNQQYISKLFRNKVGLGDKVLTKLCAALAADAFLLIYNHFSHRSCLLVPVQFGHPFYTTLCLDPVKHQAGDVPGIGRWRVQA